MTHFSALFEALDQTNKTNDKIAVLMEYFRSAPEEDIPWALHLLLGRTFKRQITSTQMRLWAAEYSGIPLWLFEESYHTIGDLSETVALLLPDPDEHWELSLRGWIAYLQKLEKQPEEIKKEKIIDAWAHLTKSERFAFNKIIMGSLRLGISRGLVVRALSQLSNIDTGSITHRLMGNWSPENFSFAGLIAPEQTLSDISTPYPFCLAHALEGEPHDLGLPHEWQAEWKWDGIRSQFIYRKGEIFIWSRGEDLVTDRFPELHIIRERIPEGTVLDGEILPYRESPLPFQILQTRIGRKTLTAKVLQEAPVVLMCYDVLEFGGSDIRNKSMEERRRILEGIVAGADLPGVLIPSPLVEFRDWDELSQKRELSREHYAEGFMLKRRDSIYQIGRKKGDWWKWKIDPYSIDAVLVYAQKGHGRRADLFTDYTFAVWHEGQLISFAKAYSGLTDEEIRKVDNFVRKNTLEKFGPVRTVKPELVFEIGFEGIQQSKRHKSGVAVRFPRILRWRHDKSPEEADSLETVQALLKAV